MAQKYDVVYVRPGFTRMVTPKYTIDYVSTKWFIKINPAFLLPRHRKEMPQKIIVNGKRRGYGDFRQGLPPLAEVRYVPNSLKAIFLNFIRSTFALKCAPDEKNYYYFKIGKMKFIVRAHHTASGEIICYIYNKSFDDKIGQLIFSKDCATVHPVVYDTRAAFTIDLILGYITGTVASSRAFSTLAAEVKILYI